MKVSNLGRSLLIWGLPDEEGIDYVKGKVAVEGLRLIVPEMRPCLLGLELMDAFSELDPFYITDNMLGHLLYRDKVSCSVLFCGTFEKNGAFTIPGGLYVVHLLRFHGVPISVRLGAMPDLSSFMDKDASSISGRLFYKEAKVVPTEAELVPWDLIS